MKPSKTLAPRLAWELSHQLSKLNLLLWDCYEEDFAKLATEERIRLGKASEEELELEIPF
jgi:hypothetical protein